MTIVDLYSLSSSGTIYIQEREEVNICLQLEQTNQTCLNGTVYTPCQKPITNATVNIYNQENNLLFKLLTNKKGVYTLYNLLEPGIYYVDAIAKEYLLSNREKIRVTKNTEITLDFYLKVNKLNWYGIIYGRVFDSKSGKPLKNTEITLVKYRNEEEKVASTYTNREGQYIIYNLKPEEYTLIAQQFDYKKIYTSVRISKKCKIKKDFRLQPNCYFEKRTISGTVIKNHELLDCIPVFLFKVTEDGNEILIETQLTNQGRFQFNQVPLGNYIVKAKLQDNFGEEDLITIQSF